MLEIRPVENVADDNQPMRDLVMFAVFETDPTSEPGLILYYQADIVSSVLDQKEYLEYLNWVEGVFENVYIGDELEDEEIIGRFFIRQTSSVNEDNFSFGLYLENILSRDLTTLSLLQNVEPTDAEKEEKLRVFIQAKAAGSDPDAVLLSKHIDDIKVVVEDKVIMFMVYREIEDEKELYRLFELLFFAGLAHSANDRNEIIWDTDSIGVAFVDEEYAYIDIYMDREGFQEYFTNPEDLYSIVHFRTSND